MALLNAKKVPGVGTRVNPGSVPGKKPALPALKPSRTLTTNPVIPKYTPGALGASAQRELGNLQSKYQLLTSGGGQLARLRQQALNAIEANRLRTQDGLRTGLEGANNNAAARGVFQSGIRLGDRSRIASAAQQQLNELTNQQTAAEQDYSRGMSEADLEYRQGQTDIMGANEEQAYNSWLQSQAPPQAPKSAQVFSYPQWIEYHRRAGTKLPTGTALKARYEAYAQNQLRLLTGG